VTATQPYRGRHWAPDDEQAHRDAATADTASPATLDPTADDDGPQPALVAGPTDSDPDRGDTAPAEAEVEGAPAPRKRKVFALRGGKAR
jgi:hypothetical protein